MQILKKVFPSFYKIDGKCKKCGQCCKEILLKMTPRQINSKFFRGIVVKWLSWLYDFYLLDIDYINCYLAFSCKHRGDDGKCQNYFFRPPICRNFPLFDYFKKPTFIPNCGFNALVKIKR